MANYIMCPRCELNFIDADEQELCDVCLAELAGDKTFVDGLDEEDIHDETELCPVCGENYMRFGEAMCDACKAKEPYEEEPAENEEENDDAWRSYLDEDSEEDLDIAIPEGELMEEEEEEEEEVYENEEEDFEYVSPDDYYPDDDDDDEDDDDEDF